MTKTLPCPVCNQTQEIDFLRRHILLNHVLTLGTYDAVNKVIAKFEKESCA